MEEAQIQMLHVLSSPLSEAPIVVDHEALIVVDVQASPLSEAPIAVDLEASLERELDTLWGNAYKAENFTIFRTPHFISQSKKHLFEPSVISIGPFHHGQKQLRAMEEQKRRFLRDFLSRKDHITLDLCITEMKSLETRTRSCYSETFDDLNSDTFAEMMLLDGCFILEYFSKRMEEHLKENYEKIREVGWNCHFIKRDLLLQENQIPFFIVEKLLKLIGLDHAKKILVKYFAYCLLAPDFIFLDPPAETPNTIDSIIASSLAEISDLVDEIPDPPAETPNTIDSIIAYSPAEISDLVDEIPDLVDEILDPPAEIPYPLAKIPNPPDNIHHLVHLCYHCIVPNPQEPVVLSSKSFDLTAMFRGLLHWFRSRLVHRGKSRHSHSRRSTVPLLVSTQNISSMVIPCATELKQKGLKFTTKSNPKHMLDISFKYGVLEIPKLAITGDTKTIFPNLLAFEHSKYGKKNSPFGRFLAFFDHLVNTPNDVTILQECGIIENWLGSEEELVNFINQTTKGNFLPSNHYLSKLYTEVNRYTESSWHRNRAKLIRDYFSSPWKVISLVAAFILLVLTSVQSFFAVFTYFRSPSS